VIHYIIGVEEVIAMTDDDGRVDPYTLSKAWVSDNDLEALKMDRTVFHRDETPPAMARRILAENSPAAAMSLVKLALHGESESVRLNASKEVLRLAYEQGSDGDGREPWEGVYEKVMTDVDAMLREASQHRAGKSNKDEDDGLEPFGQVTD
jgi:hypothetical protein